MCPGFDHDAAVQHNDSVGEMQGRLPVGDQQRRSTGHDSAQRAVDSSLDARVNRAGGVVEDEDPWVVEDRARQGDPLTLTAGEGQPTLPDGSVIPARELLDKLVRLSCTGGRLDLFVGRVRPSVRDVRANGVREEEAVLEDDANLASERVQRDRAHIETVHEDRSLRWVVETRDEHRQGRLAATARADDGDALARRDVELDPVEHRVTVVVREVHVREADVTPKLRKFDRIRCVADGRGQVEELKDALKSGTSLLADGQDTGKLTGRRHQLGGVRRERQEGAERDVVMEGQPAAEGQDGHLGEQRDRLEKWLIA